MKKIKGRKYLKSRFQAGDKPTQQDFTDLINSSINQKSDQIFAVDSKLGIGTETPEASLEIKGDGCCRKPSLKASDGNSSLWVRHPRDGIVALSAGNGETLVLGSICNHGQAKFSPKMTINANGKVTILQEATDTLEVKGSMTVVGNIEAQGTIQSTGSISSKGSISTKTSIHLDQSTLWVEGTELKIKIGEQVYNLSKEPISPTS